MFRFHEFAERHTKLRESLIKTLVGEVVSGFCAASGGIRHVAAACDAFRLPATAARESEGCITPLLTLREEFF